jgi:hypothetical protein
MHFGQLPPQAQLGVSRVEAAVGALVATELDMGPKSKALRAPDGRLPAALCSRQASPARDGGVSTREACPDREGIWLRVRSYIMSSLREAPS